MGISCADHVTPSTRKSRHYFADSGGISVGIVRLRTKATEFFSHMKYPTCLPNQLHKTDPYLETSTQ
jgi:hypothetical protein